MGREGEAARALMQEIYLQELALSAYRIYLPCLRDAKARVILETYLKGEDFRATQIEHYLRRQGFEPTSVIRHFFRGLGRLYGRLTAFLGTRIMLRIVLSASKRTSRGLCAAVSPEAPPDLIYLNTLRARNEGDLLDSLRQHMINSRHQKG